MENTKNQEYLEQIEHNLNSAFSMNYVILQTIEKLKSSLSQTEDNSSLFGMLASKSYQQNYYSDNLEAFAESRNRCFAEAKAFFNADNFFSVFKENSTALIESYNKAMKKNVNHSDVFSEREIKSWSTFNQIFEDVNSIMNSIEFEEMKLIVMMAEFLMFYEQYKVWISSYELFETLENDINSNGSKSIHHGKPLNPNVKVMTTQEFRDIASKFISIRDGALKSKIKTLNSKKTADMTEDETLEQTNLDLINQLFNRLQDRFAFTNTHIMELGGIWSRLRFKLTPYSKDQLKIEQTYVHKNELLSLASSLSLFSEFDDLVKEIYDTYLTKNVDLSQKTEKENN